MNKGACLRYSRPIYTMVPWNNNIYYICFDKLCTASGLNVFLVFV